MTPRNGSGRGGRTGIGTTAGVATTGVGGFFSGSRSSVTFGAVSDRYAGLIHLNRDGTNLHAGLLRRDGHHGGHRGGRHGGHGLDHYGYYPFGHYYHHYRPIYYDPLYVPSYGYTYGTVYYDAPYAYRFYDSQVYVQDRDCGGARADAEYDGRSRVNDGAGADGVAYRSLTAPSDDSLIGQGNTAFAAGRYDEARRLYVSAMLADERDGHAKLLYAVANFAAGDYTVAGLALRRALLTTPALADAPPDFRVLYAERAVLDAQIAALRDYVEARPKDRSGRLLLGYLLYASGEAEHAAELFGAMTAADPEDTVTALLRDAAVRMVARLHK